MMLASALGADDGLAVVMFLVGAGAALWWFFWREVAMSWRSGTTFERNNLAGV